MSKSAKKIYKDGKVVSWCPEFKSRNWCFTWNNYPEDFRDKLIIGLKPSFLHGQLEIGAKGTPHVQGYLEFKNAKRFSTIRALIKGWHVEPREGTQKQAMEYCLKQDHTAVGPIEPYGEMAKQGKRNDLLAVKDAIDGGATNEQIAEEHFNSWCRYNKSFHTYRQMKCPQRNWEMEVHIYWGKTGTGKTRRAFEENPNAYMKPDGEWWDGYDGHETVIFDEFYGDMPWPMLLRVTDRYPMRVPVKGSFVQLSARKIIFTSNQNPRDWYPGRDFAPLQRRITNEVEFK